MHVQRKMYSRVDLCRDEFTVLDSSFMVSSRSLCLDCGNLIDVPAATYNFSHLCFIRTQFNKMKPSLNVLMTEGFLWKMARRCHRGSDYTCSIMDSSESEMLL